MQNVPYSLYVASKDFLQKCQQEDDRDVRHLGRYLTFSYTCPGCGPKLVDLTPDYPYCGANSVWTCSICYEVMILNNEIPVNGIPKKCMTTRIRESS